MIINIRWQSNRIHQRRPGRIFDFSVPYLVRRINEIRLRGIVQGYCLVNLTSKLNYVMVSLNENGTYINTNYHQVYAYARWGVTSGWMGDEYYVVSHLCHNINCLGSINGDEDHFSFEPQAVNIARQRCVRAREIDNSYTCYGHIYNGLNYPCCIFY